MNDSNSVLTKRVDFLALDHLLKRNEELNGAGKNDAAYKDCNAAIKLLCSNLGIDPKNKTDSYHYSSDANLKELIVAGTEIFGSYTSNKRPNEDADFQSSAKFLKYLDSVKKKGAFSGKPEGSREYEETMEKVKKAYLERFEPKKAALSTEDAEKAAESCKLEGNDKLAASDYPGAIACYDKAIELSSAGPNTHIYLSNRAAAYTHLKDYEKAAEDCSAAIALKPDFAKAYSRLASAQLNMNLLDEAEKSAQRALQLDATNGVALSALDRINQIKAQSSNRAGAASVAPRGAPRGLPRGFPGGGGMPDMSQLMQAMNDPAMMAMAQQMMQDPNAMANIMNMMGGAGGPRGM